MMDLAPDPEADGAVVEPRILGLALFPGCPDPELDSPAPARRPGPSRHRHLDVVGVDGVLLGQVPDLQSQRVHANRSLDPGTQPEPSPSTAHVLLSRFPFAQ